MNETETKTPKPRVYEAVRVALGSGPSHVYRVVVNHRLVIVESRRIDALGGESWTRVQSQDEILEVLQESVRVMSRG